ncbi:MAG: heme exporter protein CcmD [Alphaproteobacteria bacterium]|nr:heme exporter protein CcmD [Alphaproteobacteria bacterium]MBM3733993.1 heme exporter protein CcmD [Acidimicrobiia bacterium]MBM3950023.1 heme exporter protein CcmD [Rhodospirillales bacterium]
MSDLAAYFAMGGYGAFVWPSFAVTLAVLILVWFASDRQLKRNERALAEMEKPGKGPR